MHRARASEAGPDGQTTSPRPHRSQPISHGRFGPSERGCMIGPHGSPRAVRQHASGCIERQRNGSTATAKTATCGPADPSATSPRGPPGRTTRRRTDEATRARLVHQGSPRALPQHASGCIEPSEIAARRRRGRHVRSSGPIGYVATGAKRRSLRGDAPTRRHALDRSALGQWISTSAAPARERMH